MAENAQRGPRSSRSSPRDASPGSRVHGDIQYQRLTSPSTFTTFRTGIEIEEGSRVLLSPGQHPGTPSRPLVLPLIVVAVLPFIRGGAQKSPSHFSTTSRNPINHLPIVRRAHRSSASSSASSPSFPPLRPLPSSPHRILSYVNALSLSSHSIFLVPLASFHRPHDRPSHSRTSRHQQAHFPGRLSFHNKIPHPCSDDQPFGFLI